MFTSLDHPVEVFHYSPKRSKNQRVLNLPELKIVKPSDTRWLVHERCVKAVNVNYATIVITLENIYEQTHEPDTLRTVRLYQRRIFCQQYSFLTLYFL